MLPTSPAEALRYPIQHQSDEGFFVEKEKNATIAVFPTRLMIKQKMRTFQQITTHTSLSRGILMVRLFFCFGLFSFLAGCGSDNETATPPGNEQNETSTQSETNPSESSETAPGSVQTSEPSNTQTELTQEDLMQAAAKTTQSRNNLKQMTLALHNYLSAHGHFPPAIVLGPDGKPWHSWRVFVLPFMEQASLNDAYRFTEPWNSEHNMKIAETILPMYNDPIHDDPKSNFTHYAAAVGDDTVLSTIQFDGTEAGLKTALKDCTRIEDLKDGTSNTIMIGTINPSEKIVWTEPRDVEVDQDQFKLSNPGSFATPHNLTSQNEAGEALFGMGDGSVRNLPAKLPPAVVKTFFTKSGMEKLTFGEEF